MRILPVTGILFVALAAGCSNGRKPVPESTAQIEPQATAPTPAESPTPPAEPIAPVPPETVPPATVAADPAQAEAGPETETPAAPPVPKLPPQKVAVEKPAVSEPGPVAPPPAPAKPEAPPPPAARPSTPTLDVNALKEKLKETKAIGVFTKLTLKNQVDDLLQQFRAYYQAKQKRDIAALRQAYDMLVLKVLSLIQDGDPTLARTIAASREAIWAMLADPVKFNSLM